MGRFINKYLKVLIRESFFIVCILVINFLFVILGLNLLDWISVIILDILIVFHYLLGFYLTMKVRNILDVFGFLLFPIFFTMIATLLYYFLIDFGIMGGTIVIPIVIIFISFLIITALFQLIKNRSIYINVKKNQQFNYLTSSIGWQFLVLILSIVFFLLFAVSPYLIISVNTTLSNNEAEIQDIVLDIIKDCKNDTQKVDALLSWFDKNFSEPNFADMNYRAKYENAYFRFSGISYIYEKTPHLCFRKDDNPHWIINSRCGRCGEHADLFLDMATKAGLSARKISSKGENHEWNEVNISDDVGWIPVDATEVNSGKNRDGFVTFDFMEKKVGGDLRKYRKLNVTYGNVSYVYATYYEDGKMKTMDRTSDYTDIINITLNITDNAGNPVEGVKVKVFSYNRPKWCNKEIFGISNTTNSTGQCTFKIGGGEYRFVLKKGDFSSVSTNNYNFNETEKQHFTGNIIYDCKNEEKDDIYGRILPVLLIGLLIVGIVILIMKKSKKS